MRPTRNSLRGLAGTAGFLFTALPALAQQLPQNLTVAFTLSLPQAPLSDWLTAVVAILVGATALIAMRGRRSRGIRYFSALLALAAGATVLSVTGERLMQVANANQPAQINLVTSPATLDVSPFLFISPLTVTVTNQTQQFAKITAITLAAGVYAMSTPTSCAVGLTLGPTNTCIITLVAVQM